MSEGAGRKGIEATADIAVSLAPPEFSALDRRFAEFIARYSRVGASAVPLAAAIVSRARGAGHSCVDLRRIAGGTFPSGNDREGPSLTLPEFDAWTSELLQSGVVARPGGFAPLVLDDAGRLYLHRYWNYEDRLARAIRARTPAQASPASGVPPDEWLAEALARYFPSVPSHKPDWQKFAVFTALTQSFCVISGGPGTGKTRTVAVVVAMLLESNPQCPPRVMLAAPTGKAAARLQESITATAAVLPCSETVRAHLPQEAVTLHRLLGLMPDSSRARHDARNPLPVDVVVVDEASMVDLALMSKLFDALPHHARVILLGDKDQLASIEAGAVLGDICDPSGIGAYSERTRAQFRRVTGDDLPEGPPGGSIPLSDCVVQLRTNFRFGSGSALPEVSRAISEGDVARSLSLLDPAQAKGGREGFKARMLPNESGLKAALRDHVLRHIAEVFHAPDPQTALRTLGRFRILCATRQGPFGVEQVNRMVEEILTEERLVPFGQAWYAGRPILIRRNHYGLRLFNGDLGVIWDDETHAVRLAYFADPRGALRAAAPARLPEHETAYAMTVHKSQGSEFEEVLLILPDVDSPILTRELLYTGLTRASRRAEMWANEPVLRALLGRRIERGSGLRDALWNREPE